MNNGNSANSVGQVVQRFCLDSRHAEINAADDYCAGKPQANCCFNQGCSAPVPFAFR
jgi:hypothetical protein